MTAALVNQKKKWRNKEWVEEEAPVAEVHLEAGLEVECSGEKHRLKSKPDTSKDAGLCGEGTQIQFYKLK